MSRKALGRLVLVAALWLVVRNVRCRDWRMLGPLVGRAAYIFARLCYRLICLRKHQEEHYLRGYANGIRTSLRYRVDRAARLYAPPAETGQRPAAQSAAESK